MPRLILILLLLLAVIANAQTTSLTLANVESFDNSNIGYAGTPSPNYEAFRAEYKKGQKALPIFEKLLKEGKPAARIYAAIGLYGLDKNRGQAALQSLKTDTTAVRTMNCCEQTDTTVGEVVTELLVDNGQNLHYWLPQPTK